MTATGTPSQIIYPLSVLKFTATSNDFNAELINNTPRG